MQLAFLVLNYKNHEETVKCIQSIRQLQLDSYAIVVVDNGSGDGSAEKLTQQFGDDSRIHILPLPENLGFSGGNNVGYGYIRSNMDPEFVVVTNNDVLFPQADLYQRLADIYEKTHFHVFGPDIYVRQDRIHQSPITLRVPTVEAMRRELEMYSYYQQNPEKWVERRAWQQRKDALCQRFPLVDRLYNKLRKKAPIDRAKPYENVCVQGACIIISRLYLENEEKMFSPEPFLYCEEMLLFIKCQKKGYTVIYDPSVQIWHEDSSTMKRINKNALERARFTLKHHVAARKLLLAYMEDENLC